jgi:hypothetical protein
MSRTSRSIRAVAAVTICLVAASWHAPASAQTGLQAERDGRGTMLSKDVGGERWAIRYDPGAGTITGNVFLTDGSDPKFVWCARVGDDGVLDPRNVQISFSCDGADRCSSLPCLETAWQHIADVTLPGSFFLPARDPFSPLQPSGAFCDPSAVAYELIGGEPSLQINTQGCNYVTLWQPTLTDLRAGDEIYLRVWHFSLTAPAPGTAYLAIQLGDQVVWSTELPIPSEGGLIADQVVAPADAPAGTPIYFHLQNHGENSYNLIQASHGETGPTLVSPAAWTIVSDGVPTRPSCSLR